MNVRIFLASSVLASFGGWAGAETWDRFRGPDGAGVARNQNLPVELDEAKNLVWKVEVPGLGNSSPVIWNDFVYLQTAAADGSTRTVLCLDAKTGKKIWDRTTKGIKATTHKLNTLASATPATDGKALYIATWDGKNVTLSALTMTGEPMWEHNLGEFVSQHGAGASPMIYRDTVYYAFDSDKKSTVFAFDKVSGKPKWSQPREAVVASYAAPLIEKGPSGDELIITSSAAVTSYNPETGSRNWNWTWNWGGPKAEALRTIAGAIRIGDMLVVSSGTSAGRQAVGLSLPTALGATPVQLWDNKDIKQFPYVPRALYAGGYLYFVHDKGSAGCYDPKTGKKIWFEPLQRADFTASPVLVDGKVYTASEEGDLFVFAAEPKFQLLGRSKIGGCIRATPAVADGRILIRDTTHLYSFGKKG